MLRICIQNKWKYLQDIAKLTQEEAKDQLLKSVEQDITSEKAALIRDLTQKAKDEALKNGKRNSCLCYSKMCSRSFSWNNSINSCTYQMMIWKVE